MTVLVVVLVAAGMLALFVVSPWMMHRNHARSRAGREQHLRTAPANVLAQEVRPAIGLNGWDRLAPELLADREWTDRKLLDALDALFAVVAARDPQPVDDPRDTAFFAFYDSGLPGIIEVLRERLDLPRNVR